MQSTATPTDDRGGAVVTLCGRFLPDRVTAHLGGGFDDEELRPRGAEVSPCAVGASAVAHVAEAGVGVSDRPICSAKIAALGFGRRRCGTPGRGSRRSRDVAGPGRHGSESRWPSGHASTCRCITTAAVDRGDRQGDTSAVGASRQTNTGRRVARPDAPLLGNGTPSPSRRAAAERVSFRRFPGVGNTPSSKTPLPQHESRGASLQTSPCT